MKNHNNKTHQFGFSLIEVMIAVLVLSVGILAVSKLQSSLIRSGSHANQKSVAANIVNRKIDDLSRFINLSSINSWASLTTLDSNGVIIASPISLAYEHIQDNTGGRIHPGTLTVGKVDYYLEWSVINYYATLSGTTPSTTASGEPVFKVAHVIATWDGVGDDTNNIVSFDSVIYRHNPSLTTTSNGAGTGNDGPTDKIDENFNFSGDITEIDIEDGNTLIGGQIAPDISARGLSNIVEFESIVFNTSTNAIQRRDKFKTVACVCTDGSSNDETQHLIGYLTWDNIAKVTINKVALSTYTNVNTDLDTSGPDNQLFECNVCCRDGRDRNNVEQENKVCRLKQISGGFKLIPDWKLIGFNIIPEGFSNTTTNNAAYSTYVTSVVRSAAQVEADNGITYFLDSYTTVDNSFATYAAALIAAGQHAQVEYGSTKQLQARAIYMDEIPDGAYEGTTYTPTNIPLDRIPFFEVNLALLAGWSPDEGVSAAASYAGDHLLTSGGTRQWDIGQHDDVGDDCSGVAFNCVSNEALIDGSEDTYSRGLFNENEGLTQTSTVEAQLYTRSDGWVDRQINNETVNTTSIAIEVVSP